MDSTSTRAETTNGLSTDVLLSLTPVQNNTDTLVKHCKDILMSYLINQSHIKDAFFPDEKLNRIRDEEIIDSDWFDFEFLGNLLMFKNVYHIKDTYKINKMVDGKTVEELLKDICSSSDWKKLGFNIYTSLFPDFVKDRLTNLTFRKFMENGAYWARELSQKMLGQNWVYSVLHPLTKGNYTEGQFRRDMNIQFMKLHLLDPQSVMITFMELQRVLPKMSLDLVTTDYLGGPIIFDKQISDSITKAVNKATSPTHASKLSLDELEIFYGEAVIKFITSHGKDFGIWTGYSPDNRKISRFKDRCIIL
ncbi:unnamed protein product [Owenia fusiformis]|uniref:Uncharacterized protein n=1 Tax=Owenia fusiformis TaxID=6347 RepID=A0A8J1U264_OWEFU|nr:unnamed protein product [Owenia fusiformis]